MPRNLFELVRPFPDWAIGTRVTRNLWNRYPEPSFWKITRVTGPSETSRTKTRFRVWGELTFRGKATGKEQQITPIWKRGWAHLDIPGPPAVLEGIRMKPEYREPLVRAEAAKGTSEEASSEAPAST